MNEKPSCNPNSTTTCNTLKDLVDVDNHKSILSHGNSATNNMAATSVSVSDGSTSSSPAKGHQDASCRSCVAMVREILQNPTSRPRQVLEALVLGGLKQGAAPHDHHQQPSFVLKPIEEGVQVEMRVPDEPWTTLRLWKDIAPSTSLQQSQHVTNDMHPLVPVLATSSSLSSSSSSLVVGPEPPATTTTKSRNPTKYVTETIRIECRPCDNTGPEQGARALIMGPNPLSIVACTNRLAVHDRHEMSQVLVHELLHAYDVKRLRLDFSDCESMAYSEVRAAREAECFPASSSNDPMAAGFSSSSSSLPTLHFLKEYCVKQKAIAATHNLFPSPKGRNCVRAVFAAAYKDPRPFSPEEVNQFVQRNQQQQQQSTNAQPNQTSTSHYNNHFLPHTMSSGSQK